MGFNSYFQTFTISYGNTFIIACVMHAYVFFTNYQNRPHSLKKNKQALFIKCV